MGPTREATTYREDGWPYCPRCQGDELYSVVMLGWNGEDDRPTLARCYSAEFRCYFCRWRGLVEEPCSP